MIVAPAPVQFTCYTIVIIHITDTLKLSGIIKKIASVLEKKFCHPVATLSLWDFSVFMVEV
jgi:hypothetical protein